MYHGIFDTHAHYTDHAFDADRTELLTRFPEEGVSHVMLCGCTPADSKDCLALAQQFPHVYCAVGVHPENLEQLPPDWLEQLRALWMGAKIAVVRTDDEGVGVDTPEDAERVEKLLLARNG